MNYGMQLFSHDAHNQLVMLQTKNVDGKKFVWFDYLNWYGDNISTTNITLIESLTVVLKINRYIGIIHDIIICCKVLLIGGIHYFEMPLRSRYNNKVDESVVRWDLRSELPSKNMCRCWIIKGEYIKHESYTGGGGIHHSPHSPSHLTMIHPIIRRST